MNKMDFSQRRRMGKGAYLILFVKAVRSIFQGIFPIIIVIAFNGKGLHQKFWTIAIVLGLFLLITVVMSLIRYFYTSFQVKDGVLYMYGSFIAQKTTSIPIERIHNMRSKSGIFYQMIDMEGLEFDTVGKKGADAELLLTKAEANALRTLVGHYDTTTNKEQSISTEKADEKIDTSTTTKPLSSRPKEESLTIRYGLRQLLLGAYTQNHLKAFVAIGWILSLLYQYTDQYITKYSDLIIDQATTWAHRSSFVSMLLLLATAYLLSLLIWGTRIAIRQYGLTVQFRPNRLEYTAGLLTITKQRIQRSKVIFVSIKQNALEKWAGLHTIQFEQAKKVSGNEKNHQASITIYGWQDKNLLTDWWMKADSSLLTAQATYSSWALARRTFGLKVFPWILLTLIPVLIWDTSFLIITALWTSIGLAQAYFTYKHSAIATNDTHILLHAGCFAHKMKILPIERVEQVELEQTIWQQRSRTAHLTMRTMGQTCTIRYIPYDLANAIRNQILRTIEDQAFHTSSQSNIAHPSSLDS